MPYKQCWGASTATHAGDAEMCVCGWEVRKAEEDLQVVMTAQAKHADTALSARWGKERIAQLERTNWELVGDKQV